MSRVLIFILLCLVVPYANARAAPFTDTAETKERLMALNQSIDQAVVDKNAAFLRKHYASDFYFKHGAGTIDSKESWINNVLNAATQFRSRMHDSMKVELHNDIALVTGILTVKRPSDGKISGYALRYIRVYALRKKTWQLVSHHTTQEWHLPDAEL